MAPGEEPSGVGYEDSPFYEERDASGERVAAFRKEDSPPAKTADDYRLIYHSEIDGDVITAWKKNLGNAPKPADRADRQARVRAIKSTEHSKRPADEKWKEDMSKVGVGGKNMVWTDKGMSTNVPDPANPGFRADSQEGLEMNSAGQGTENDVNISQQSHKGEIVNPRMRFQGTSVVNHFSPVIKRPNKWTTVLLNGVVKPLIAVMKALAEEEQRA